MSCEFELRRIMGRRVDSTCSLTQSCLLPVLCVLCEMHHRWLLQLDSHSNVMTVAVCCLLLLAWPSIHLSSLFEGLIFAVESKVVVVVVVVCYYCCCCCCESSVRERETERLPEASASAFRRLQLYGCCCCCLACPPLVCFVEEASCSFVSCVQFVVFVSFRFVVPGGQRKSEIER